VKNILKDIFSTKGTSASGRKQKVAIVGVGNIMRGDDGFGPALIERLNGKIKAVCIDVGSTPENYVGTIVKQNPDVILIVDIMHLDKAPGHYEVLKPEEVLKSGLTTHDISPRMFIEYLKTQTKADVYMLGVQPQSISLGDQMSDSVKRSLEELEALIKEIDNA